MKIHESAGRVIDLLEACGHKAYVVGGCVRDALLGQTPGDWDICTSALPEQVCECLREYKTLPTGLRHGTVTAVVEGMPLEITTFRVDGPYEDNRRPSEVTFVSDVEADLARRDFTINAMAWNPASGLVDPFGGQADLEAGILRSVGDPAERLREDGLRIMRALRFSARLGFVIEENLALALHQQKDLLKNISAERLNAELCGMLRGDGVEGILLEYRDVLEVFLPELAAQSGDAEWAQTAKSVAAAPGEDAVRLALLLYRPGGDAAQKAGAARAALTRLRFDNATIRAVGELIRWLGAHPWPDDVVKWLSLLGEERLAQLIETKKALLRAGPPQERDSALPRWEELAVNMRAALATNPCYRLCDLAVDGGDIIAAGVAPGPEVGRILRVLLERVVDGELPNEKVSLLASLPDVMDEADKK